MNDCCKKTLEEEYKEIKRQRPYLHWCPEWDGMLIDEKDPEFECCACFPDVRKPQYD